MGLDRAGAGAPKYGGLSAPAASAPPWVEMTEFRRGDWAESGFEAEGKLLDDRVGEDLAGDALDFELGPGRIGGEGVVEGELEVFSLADVGHAVVLHAAERAGDGLALGIEHGPLTSDVHM